MTSSLKSSASTEVGAHPQAERREAAPHGWLKVGAVAAASAVLGGLAAAWFYRKTLSQLRDAGERLSNSESGTTEDESAEDF
jgi:hypothetical protein